MCECISVSMYIFMYRMCMVIGWMCVCKFTYINTYTLVYTRINECVYVVTQVCMCVCTYVIFSFLNDSMFPYNYEILCVMFSQVLQFCMHLVYIYKDDNEMILGAVHRSPGICQENPRKPQLGDRLMKELCNQS